ncbi:ATP-dependent protease [Xanthomonas phage XaC1]|nr:ATP-dependent protease [Xanthomonas phage XaC1]
MSHTIDSLFKDSNELAKKFKHDLVTTDHLALATIKVPSIRDFFLEIGHNPREIEEKLEAAVSSLNIPKMTNIGQEPIGTSNFGTIKLDVKKEAIIQQLKANNVEIEPFFILLECLSFTDTVFEKVLETEDTTASEIAAQLQSYLNERDYNLDIKAAQEDMNEEPSAENLGGTSRGKSAKSAIEEYTTDLTQDAKDGKLDPLIGREVELHDIIQVLSRKTKKNVALTGDPGVGKTQIVNGLAHMIVSGNVPESLKAARILNLNVSTLLAGTKFRGEFESRVERLIKEVKENPEIVLFIDEIHTMMGAGGGGSSGGTDMSNMLKPALSKGEMRVIGATTYEEYNKHIEKDPALTRRFMKLNVAEPTFEETKLIITGLKKTYEKFHNVKYPRRTLDVIMDLASKYITNKKFPDKAIDLMDAAGARNKVKEVPNTSITREDIEYEVSRIANLPIEIVSCQESDRMMNLEDNLRKQVFGQDKAITSLVDNVMVARAGLRDKASIQGAFLFVGPSGTGKTEISKALAESLGVELIRFDMAEYAQEHTVSKLIGSPPGYVGHDSGNGALLDKVEQQPNCVLLFDEIEKAHPKVMQTFLQLLDEGRLTGSHGKTVYFNNVTVIMTSNLGARNVDVRPVGFGGSKGKDGIDTAVRAALAPEFINRLDAIIKFNELDESAIESIIDKFITIINDDIKDRKVKVVLDASAKKWLAANGTEKGMGARPMKRCINENIKRVLAKEMLFGTLVGGGKAKFTATENGIELVKVKVVTAEVEEVLPVIEE